VVDAWAICDQHQLDWLSTHQANLRAELYNGVADAPTRTDVDLASVGRRVILPSSYLGSARFIGQCYQDSMAIVRQYGRPSLFITLTANGSFPSAYALPWL
jgi:Helitron helicase-like domain at N-terminus